MDFTPPRLELSEQATSEFTDTTKGSTPMGAGVPQGIRSTAAGGFAGAGTARGESLDHVGGSPDVCSETLRPARSGRDDEGEGRAGLAPQRLDAAEGEFGHAIDNYFTFRMVK